MAEEKNIFCIRAERGVEMVLALVAVLRDQEVKLLDDAAVDRVNAGIFVGRGVHPVFGVIVHGLARPMFGEKVPAVAGWMEVGTRLVACVKFAQPRTDLDFLSDGLHGEARGGARSSEGGGVIRRVRDF